MGKRKSGLKDEIGSARQTEVGPPGFVCQGSMLADRFKPFYDEDISDWVDRFCSLNKDEEAPA